MKKRCRQTKARRRVKRPRRRAKIAARPTRTERRLKNLALRRNDRLAEAHERSCGRASALASALPTSSGGKP